MIKSTNWKEDLYPQRKWELDKAAEYTSESNFVVVEGKSGIGKSFFVNKLTELSPKNTKHLNVSWLCQDGEVNDVHQLGMRIAGEVQKLNADCKLKKRKKAQYLNISLGVAGLIVAFITLGEIGFYLGLLLGGIPLLMELYTKFIKDSKEEKRYTEGHSFTLASLVGDIEYSFKNSHLEKLTLVLSASQYLDAGEQEALSYLIDSLTKIGIKYQIFLESPEYHKFDMLMANKNISVKTISLNPISEIGNYLRQVFPSISDSQVSLLLESSAGNPRIIKSTIDNIYDNSAFFDSMVNTSKIKDDEFELELKHHVLDGDFYLTNSAFINRNFTQLKVSQQDFLVAVAHISSEYSTQVLEESSWKYSRRFSELVLSENWFDVHSLYVRFKSKGILDYLLEQRVDEKLLVDIKSTLITTTGALAEDESNCSSECLFSLTKQALSIECSCSRLTLELFSRLVDSEDGYYITQLSPLLYKRISQHASFDDKFIDDQFASVFINTVDVVEDSIFTHLYERIDAKDSLSYRLCSVWERYVKGDIDTAIELTIALIQRNQSGEIQHWLHDNLFNFLSLKIHKLKTELKRARILNTSDSLASIDSLKNELSIVYTKLSDLDSSINILIQLFPERAREFQWLSLLVLRKLDNSRANTSVLAELEKSLGSLSAVETLMGKIIDIDNFALENAYLESNSKYKEQGKQFKNEIRDRIRAIGNDVSEVFKNTPLDNKLWGHLVAYFYWFTHYHRFWFKNDDTVELQNILLELYSYRDVNKLYKSINNYSTLIKLSRVEVAFYSEHGKGILVDRAITRLQDVLSGTVFKYRFSELVNHNQLSRLIVEIDRSLYLGEYPRLKANFMKYFVDEVGKHFGKDTFFYNEMMKLYSKAGEYFTYLTDFQSAEYYYQKEHLYLNLVKISRPKNILLTEIISLLNMTNTSLKLRQSETRLNTNIKRLKLVDEKLAELTGCKSEYEYENNNIPPYRVGHIINIIENLSGVCVTLGETAKAHYYCNLSEIIMTRFRNGASSSVIVESRIDVWIADKSFAEAFGYVQNQIERYGERFLFENIKPVVRLLGSCQFDKIESSNTVTQFLRDTLQQASGLKANKFTLIEPLQNLLDAVEVHSNAFPYHPHLLQPWSNKHKNIRKPLSIMRKSLESAGNEAAWLLELLLLMGHSIPSNAEVYRQVGQALLSDSRFPEKSKLPKYASFEKRVWGDTKLLSNLLVNTHRNWGRFIQVHSSQRKTVLLEIYSALKTIYSLPPSRDNKKLLDTMLKWESKDLYMVYKRIFRHSNNRSNMFTHHEITTMFADLKTLRLTLRKRFKEKFGSYSNRNGKPLNNDKKIEHKNAA
tara:strand:- start:297 stop:4304 length:4008 start_codon:yes stop_codon:yes gene_type:complete